MNVEFLAQHGWVLAIQATVLLVVGLAAVHSAKAKGPAWQIAIYRTTLAALVALMCFSVLPPMGGKAFWEVAPPSIGPTFHLPPVKGPIEKAAVERAAVEPGIEQPRSVPSALTETSVADGSIPETRPNAISLRDLGVLVWAVGVAISLLWALLGGLWLAEMRREGAVEDLALVVELSRQIGVPAPRLLTNAKVRSPFLSGVFRPTIYLPADYLVQYDAEQLRAILAHELIHIRHGDCFWGWLARIAGAIAWPHPLVWLLQRNLRASSEELCDQVVLKQGLQPAFYADCLIRIAERTIPSRTERLMGVGVVPIRSTLGRRISLVLNSQRNTITRVSLKGRLAIATGICISGAVIALAIAPHRNPPVKGQDPSRVDDAIGSVAAAKQEPGDPAAIAMMETVREIYGKMASLSVSVRQMEGGPSQTKLIDFVYKRPGTARVTIMEKDRLEPGVTLFAGPDRFYLASPHHPHEYVIGKKQDDTMWQFRGSLYAALNAVWMERLPPVEMLEAQNDGSGHFRAIGRQPWRFGSDSAVGGVPCKDLIVKTAQRDGSIFVETLVVGESDHLIRESKADIIRNGHDELITDSVYSNIRANAPVDASAVTFKPSPGMKVIVRQSNSQRDKLPPAMEAFENVVRTSSSLSFVDEEESAAVGMQSSGELSRHTNLNRLAVEVEAPDKAHVKLELKQYEHQDMEIWSNEGREQIVIKGNPRNYVDRPLAKATNLLADVGIPGGACRTGFDLLQTRASLDSIGYFRGVQSEPTSLWGEPMDVVVQNQVSNDQYGFPSRGVSTDTYLISQRDHMLRKVIHQSTYDLNGKMGSSQTTEIFRDVKVGEPMPESDFQFTPAPGMTQASNAPALDRYREQSESAIDQTLAPGDIAPDFASKMLNGTPVTLGQYKGKVVFLHGWTFGIGNYQWDVPRYERLFQKLKDKGLVMLGIPYESEGDRHLVVDYLKKQGITHPQIFDGLGKSGGIQQVYKMGGRPFAFLIDRKGKVYARPSFDPNLEKMVEEILNKK